MNQRMWAQVYITMVFLDKPTAASSYILLQFCTQLTKAYGAKTSSNQVVIVSATYLLKISSPYQQRGNEPQRH